MAICDGRKKCGEAVTHSGYRPSASRRRPAVRHRPQLPPRSRKSRRSHRGRLGCGFCAGGTPQAAKDSSSQRHRLSFANGSPVGDIPIGSGFFRDFSPGTYNFTIQPFGLPTPQSTTLQLAAGTQTYLQAQWLASWQVGYPEADFSFAPNTFAILTMPPQVAEAYLPTLTYLGQR